MLQNQSSWGLIPKGFPIRKYSIFHAVRLETPTLNPPPPVLLEKSSFDTGEKAQAKPITELSLPSAGQLYGGTSCGRLREGTSIEKVTPWDWPGGSEKIRSLISDWWGPNPWWVEPPRIGGPRYYKKTVVRSKSESSSPPGLCISSCLHVPTLSWLLSMENSDMEVSAT